RRSTPASSTTDMATPVTVVARIPVPAVRSQSPMAGAWRRLWARPVARAGALLVCAFLAIAILTPLVHQYDPDTDSNLALRLRPPTVEHPFGTDSLGRDILVRVLHATRVSLGLGVSSVAVAAVVGSALWLI